jgi:hypothetical protein
LVRNARRGGEPVGRRHDGAVLVKIMSYVDDPGVWHHRKIVRVQSNGKAEKRGLPRSFHPNG